jgi:hypothetical protein
LKTSHNSLSIIPTHQKPLLLQQQALSPPNQILGGVCWLQLSGSLEASPPISDGKALNLNIFQKRKKKRKRKRKVPTFDF